MIQKIALHHFRNYGVEVFGCTPGINLVVGPNGHGKTNLLEAIHFACLGHSPSTRKEKDLIRWGAEEGVVRLEGILQEEEHTQSVKVHQQGQKETRVNGKVGKRLADLMGHFSLVLLSPEDIQIVQGSPNLRRKFLDVHLCQISPHYLQELRTYNRVLKQRNTLLKDFEKYSYEVLDVLDQQLGESGDHIVKERAQFIQALGPLASNYYTDVSQGRESLELAYAPSVEEDQPLTEILRKKRISDREARVTLSGPHRDNLLTLIDGKSAADFGSQGQKRLVSLSLKLACSALLEERLGRAPILLLDDVFAELDEERRIQLSTIIGKARQAFLASPREEDLPFDVQNVLRIQDGSLSC
jgi:DNA replication and repair protein RecF